MWTLFITVAIIWAVIWAISTAADANAEVKARAKAEAEANAPTPEVGSAKWLENVKRGEQMLAEDAARKQAVLAEFLADPDAAACVDYDRLGWSMHSLYGRGYVFNLGPNATRSESRALAAAWAAAHPDEAAVIRDGYLRKQGLPV